MKISDKQRDTLRRINDSRSDLAFRLLEIEQDKIAILAAEAKLRKEEDAVHEKIKAEHKLGPQEFRINLDTGEISLYSSNESPPADPAFR